MTNHFTQEEVRAALEQALDALEQIIEEKCDYMRRNYLGNPEVEHTVKYGRAALTAGREALAAVDAKLAKAGAQTQDGITAGRQALEKAQGEVAPSIVPAKSKPLTDTQQWALEWFKENGPATRRQYRNAGIASTTLNSLVRMGLVEHKTIQDPWWIGVALTNQGASK